MRTNPESYRRRENEKNYYEDLGWEKPDYNSPRVKHTRERLRDSVNRDEPDKPFRNATKRQLNPKFVGTLAAIGTAVVITADVVLNGPSNLVIEHPEAATTFLASGSAAIGALAYKLTRDMEPKQQKSSKLNHKHDQRRNKW